MDLQRLIVVVVLILAGVFLATVTIGLIRHTVDENALALALLPVISGLLVGGALRGRGGPKDKDDG